MNKWNKIESPERQKETRQKAHTPMSTLFLTNKARIYNGAKTASSINGAGKTGQLNVRE